MFKKSSILFIIVLLSACAGQFEKLTEMASVVTFSSCDDVSKICQVVPYNLEIINSSETTKPDKTLDYYSIYKNEIVSTKGYILGLPLQGQYLKRDSGLIIEEGYFENGVKTGTWKTFYQNGNIQTSVTYKNGLKDGTEELTNLDGSKTSYIIYKKGEIVPEKVKNQEVTKNDSIPNAQD